MTRQIEDSVFEPIMEQLLMDGRLDFHQVLEIIFNEAMKIERARHLSAEPYERTTDRQGYSNGFKPKQLKTTVGELSLQVPQVRDSSFYPKSLEKGTRTERTLLLTMAEMYVQGVSTRKVTKVVESLCGLEVSSTEVSRAVAELDEVFEAWRNRPIGKITYLYLDARYEKVRHGSSVVDCAVLIAAGVDENGHRSLLGVSVSLSEHENHWRTFLQSLLSRGIYGIELIISDAHAGLKAARKAVFSGIRWQRCQFHFQQNAQSYITKHSLKKPVAEKLRALFNAENKTEADRLVNLAIDEYKNSQPKLAEWLEANIHESLTVFDFPAAHRKRIRTTNILERVNREVRRRTHVATLFPNEASCCRLVTAVLMEISEDWETGKRYIVFEGKNCNQD